MGKNLFKNRFEVAGLAFILIIAGFLRLWHIDQYMTFLGDEGRDVAAVRQILLGKKIALIGPGTSVGNMYLGPLYYYLMAPALWAAGYSPVGPAIMVALFSLITIALIYIWGKQLFGTANALFISFLYAVSPVVITYSHSSWNPNVMPFFAVLAMYGIWQIWKFKRLNWLPVVGASLAFVLNSHYLGLLLFPPVILYWFLTRKAKSFWPVSLKSLFIFLILMSPLFIFDLRHHWQNSLSIIHFFTDRQQTVNFKIYKAVPNLWPVWQDIVTSLLASNNIIIGRILSWLIFIAVLFVGVRQILTKKVSSDFVYILVWLLAGLVGLGLYKQHIYVHYYGFLYPVVFLLLGFLPRFKILKYLIFVYLAYLSLFHTPILSVPNNQLHRTQQIASFIKKQSQNQPFNLALISKNNYDAGYRYFLDLDTSSVRTIHEQITDQLFVICEGECRPIGHPLWEIASFGWAKIDTSWNFPWGVTVYKLAHNPTGR